MAQSARRVRPICWCRQVWVRHKEHGSPDPICDQPGFQHLGMLIKRFGITIAGRYWRVTCHLVLQRGSPRGATGILSYGTTCIIITSSDRTIQGNHARTLQKWDVLVLESELTVSTVSECFRRRYDAYRNATFLEREERTSGPRQLAGAVSDRPSRGELAQARWAPPCSAVSGHLALSASTTGPSLPARRSHGQYARCGPLT